MDFELTQEQRMLQASARRMVAEFIEPILKAHDPEKPIPKPEMLRIFQRFGEEGLTAPRLPVEDGGSGMKMFDYGIVFEQMPSMIGHAMLSHEVTVTRIRAGSSEEQWRRLLPDMIAGRRIGCTGSTEPDTGSDSRGVRTRMRIEGEEVVVDGRKMWITNGDISDLCLVTCSAGVDANGRNQLQRVIVEREVGRYESRKIKCIGLKQGHMAELLFDNCRVPKSGAVSDKTDMARLLTVTWNANRALLGLMAVGMAQRAFDTALAYAGIRQAFGKLIGGTQLVQERLADMAAAIEASRLICYKALAAIDRGERVNALVAMAKRYATNACLDAISWAMEVHGAMGLSEEVGLEELYRDARMLLVPDGTNQILALIVGRELTGQDAFRR
ncbi:MAG: acyl-CoA/acyl-ACP dehydrogenase [Burkholderiales bacterium]|nr:acyl-CoA/acyl-ACP dehydrogenase [Burkholderiales bacterium]